MDYFMGIDFGTQSVRCGVYDENGRFYGAGECPYETFYPEAGFAEQDPSEWITALKKAVLACRDQMGETFGKIAGIALDTTSSTVVVSSRDGKPLGRAILWMDNRAKEQTEKINKTGHAVLKHCGGAVSVEWLLPKMLWLKEHLQSQYAQTDVVCEMQDYLNHYLTGRWCASISQATCKANYVESLNGYSKDFLQEIGLEDYFEKGVTDVLLQGEKIGTIRPEIAKELGLPEGIGVYQGGIDAHTSMIGLGVTHPGDMGLVMGTSFVHLAAVDRPIFSDSIWGPYKDAIIPGLYCLEGGQVSAGSITKWFLKEFGIKEENPYTVMQNEAAAIPPGSEGVLALDFFQGNRTPYKNPFAKGVFFGLTLSHTRAHIYRACLESVAFGTKNIIDNMEQGGIQIDAIMGCGGVTKNIEWLHIIADMTQKPIYLTEQSANAGILGCAIIAAVGTGRYSDFSEAGEQMVHVTKKVQPDPDKKEIYESVFQQYLELYHSLEHMMRG